MKHTFKLHDVVQCVSVTVLMSEKLVADFLTAFGDAFATKDLTEGVSYTKRVDDYHRVNADNWSVTVTVDSSQSKELLSFLKKFCGTRKLVFNRGSQKL